MIKTKIVCTLGPAVEEDATMKRLIQAGMDVARMNFSHGSHAEHGARLACFRKACAELNAHIPVLLDTKGPEIRLGEFPAGAVTIEEGQKYLLTTEPIPGDAERASVSYAGLPQDLQPGNRILFDDGLVAMEVERIQGAEIYCRALNGGALSSHKSLNVPGVSLRLPALTAQDKEDIRFAYENNYDFIAVSFARKMEDISEIIHLLEQYGSKGIKLIAKIESQEGIDNLDAIIRVSDGIMVARGDLGVEIPMEELPVIQKELIKRCYSAGKPVITATQMLDSMMRNPRPTRAEVTDVANAIYDGTSAIMLSGETAAGKYPVEALQTMKRIAAATEQSIHYWKRFNSSGMPKTNNITSAISHATCTTAMDLNAAAICAVTESGRTARRISAFRPNCPIIAATPNEKVFRQLHLSWGVKPVLVESVKSTDELFQVAVAAAEQSSLVKDGDIIVVTAGVPIGYSGTTNMLKVQMIGNILLRGQGLGAGQATGPLCFLRRAAAETELRRGCILVLDEIKDETLPLLRQAAAVILEHEDKEGKAATLALALEIPIVSGAENALQLLQPGSVVTVDADKGIVKCVECM